MNTLQLVLQLSNGAINVPLKKAALILGLEPATIRNRLSLGTWPLTPTRIVGCRNVYFLAGDIANLIDGGACVVVNTAKREITPPKQTRRMGTPSLAERQAARAVGLSVPAWRASGARKQEAT